MVKVEIIPNLENLPSELLPFKDNILATVKLVIEITLSPAQNLELWASKVGGTPYLPSPMMYPQDGDGNPLLFLAQINCEELPKNDLLPPEGILSFFIGGDDLYGLDFDNRLKQNGFKVFYFNKVLMDENLLWTDFTEIQKICVEKDLYSPLSKNTNCKMHFKLSEREISKSDFNFFKNVLNGKGFWDLVEDKDLLKSEALENQLNDKKLLMGEGHKLLGYPYFTQDDPRLDEFENYILLFQLDTQIQENFEIMCGDMGVGNFFIRPQDLEKKDFSHVLYNWDCG